MGLFGKLVDPIEEWMREVIAAVPDGLTHPGNSLPSLGMLQEGLNIYLMHEQDPYWGAESLAEYLQGERVPVPKRIIDEMLRSAGPSPASCEKIRRLLSSSEPDGTMETWIAGLVAVPTESQNPLNHSQ